MPFEPSRPAITRLYSGITSSPQGQPPAFRENANQFWSYPPVMRFTELSHESRERTVTGSSCSTLASPDANISDQSRSSSASSQTPFPYTSYLSGTESSTTRPPAGEGWSNALKHDTRHHEALPPSLVSWSADVKADQLLADRSRSYEGPILPFQTYQQPVSHQGPPCDASDRRDAWGKGAAFVVPGQAPPLIHQAKLYPGGLWPSPAAPFGYTEPYQLALEQPRGCPVVNSIPGHVIAPRQHSVQDTGYPEWLYIRDGRDQGNGGFTTRSQGQGPDTRHYMQLPMEMRMVPDSTHTSFHYPVAGMDQLRLSHQQTTLGNQPLSTGHLGNLQSQSMPGLHNKYAQRPGHDIPESGLHAAAAPVQAPMSTIPSSPKGSICTPPYRRYRDSFWQSEPPSAYPCQGPMPTITSQYLPSSTSIRGMRVQFPDVPSQLSKETTHTKPGTAAEKAVNEAFSSPEHSHIPASVTLHWPPDNINAIGEEHASQQQRVHGSQTSNPSLSPRRDLSITARQRSDHKAVLHRQYDISPSIPMTPLKHVGRGRRRSPISPYSKRKPMSPEYYYQSDLPSLPRFADNTGAEPSRPSNSQEDPVTGLGLVFPADTMLPNVPQTSKNGMSFDVVTPAHSGSSLMHTKAVEAISEGGVHSQASYSFSNMLPQATGKDDKNESSITTWHIPCSKDGGENLGTMEMHSCTTLPETELENWGKQSEGHPKVTEMVFPCNGAPSNEHHITPVLLPVDLDTAPSQPASNARSGTDSVTKGTTESPIPEVFYCSFEHCKRPFKRLEHRRRHERIHTSEKPYGCDFSGCGKFFSRSDNLAQHKRTHYQPGVRSTRAHLARAAHHSARP